MNLKLVISLLIAGPVFASPRCEDLFTLHQNYSMAELSTLQAEINAMERSPQKVAAMIDLRAKFLEMKAHGMNSEWTPQTAKSDRRGGRIGRRSTPFAYFLGYREEDIELRYLRAQP